MSVANQKIVKIGKRVARDPAHLYAKINIDALQTAVALLNKAGLSLWLYCNKNQDNYEFELSQKACFDWGIRKDSYYSGVRELIQQGYLVPLKEGSNIYIFNETPRSEKKNSCSPKKFSESKIHEFENQKNFSENQQRNITNRTLIEQKITWDEFYNDCDDFDDEHICDRVKLSTKMKEMGF